MRKNTFPTDYETYREIMSELLRPIQSEGLDDDTLKRLYESKLVYLENLRQKCFIEINLPQKQSHFSTDDQHVIVHAIRQTRIQLRQVIVHCILTNIGRIPQSKSS